MPPDRYAVIGNPVAHSKSPLIHSMFAHAAGQQLVYERIEAPLTDFAASVAAFGDAGGRGLNVTLPFKIEAFNLARSHSERAARAGAVNTLKFESEGLFGDNTDGAGLVRDLLRVLGDVGLGLHASRILVLGAGGAARGIIGPLLAEHPCALTITNRDLHKALELAQRFEGGATTVDSVALEALTHERFDLVINATSAGLGGVTLALPERMLRGAQLVYDLAYGDGPPESSTPFLARAVEEGAVRTADGLGMLVEQAALSFALWRGITPATAPVLAALRSRDKGRT